MYQYSKFSCFDSKWLYWISFQFLLVHAEITRAPIGLFASDG